MSIIVTNNTDQYKVLYGYCSKCYCYNEVWRKDKTSECGCCGTKMYHIKSRWIYIALFLILGSLLMLI